MKPWNQFCIRKWSHLRTPTVPLAAPQGLGTTALGLCTAALLPLGLATATFLTASERHWLAQRVGGAAAGGGQAPSAGTSPLQQQLLVGPPTRKASSSHLLKPTASTRQAGDPSSSAGSESGAAGGGGTGTADPAYYPPSDDDDDAKAKDAGTYDGAGGWGALAEAACNWRLWYVSFMGLLKNMAAHGILFWAPIINKALLEGQDLDPRGGKLDWDHHRSGSVVTAAAAPRGAGIAGEVDVAGGGAADADEPAARVQAVSTFAVLLTGIPFACAAGMALWLGRRSQARRERSMHLAVPYGVGAVLLAALPLLAAESPVLGFIAVSIAVACVQVGGVGLGLEGWRRQCCSCLLATVARCTRIATGLTYQPLHATLQRFRCASGVQPYQRPCSAAHSVHPPFPVPSACPIPRPPPHPNTLPALPSPPLPPLPLHSPPPSPTAGHQRRHQLRGAAGVPPLHRVRVPGAVQRGGQPGGPAGAVAHRGAGMVLGGLRVGVPHARAAHGGQCCYGVEDPEVA